MCVGYLLEILPSSTIEHATSCALQRHNRRLTDKLTDEGARSLLIKKHAVYCIMNGFRCGLPEWAVPVRKCGSVLQVMTKKILIVEDNELNMKLFCDLLAVHGYETVQTREGLKALDLAREHKPDLILMDIQLPEVSGLDVTRRIKNDGELSTIPVVAVTAFAMKGDEERIRESGCDGYLSKPITIASFIQTVRDFLGHPQDQGESDA